MKKCNRCKEDKELTNFGVDKSKKDGMSIYCSNCRNLMTREFMKAHPHKKRVKNLRDRYKLSPSDYAALVKNQKGMCLGCGKSEKLCIDHDHITGKVRGLLCFSCNMALGFIQDNPDILRNLAVYLEK